MVFPVLPKSGLRRFAFVLLSAAGLSYGAQAQSTAPIQLALEDQHRGAHGVQKNFYFSTKAEPTDDDYQNAGFFGQHLRPYLAGNAEALDNLNNYRRQKWLYLLERTAFVGSIGAYGALTFTGDDKPHYFSDPQKVVLGVAAVSLLSNIFITRRTNQHFERAVNAYNGDLPAARRTGLHQLVPAGVGVAAAPGGQPLLALSWQLR